MLHELGHVPAAPVSAQLGAARAHAHHGPSSRRPRHGSALCLSGGGFRAALFHLGAVQRLDELGVLGRLRTISAVSGGALVANLLAHPGLAWPDPSGPGGWVGGLSELVVEPLRRLTARNARTPAMLARLRPGGWGRPDAPVRALTASLLTEIPWWERICARPGEAVRSSSPATEVGYGVSWVFADARSVWPRGRVGDHRLGSAAEPPGVRIVDAVVASCAHAPWFPAVDVDGTGWGLTGGVADPQEALEVRHAILRRIQLADGGVYDNLGLEPVWTDYETVLVSDGGALFRGQPAGSVVGRLWRLLSIAAGGGHTTRLRWLRSAFSAGLLHGATWSLETPTSVSTVPGHGLPAGVSGAYPDDVVATISRIRTDLDAFTTDEQHVLERHGYVVADSSLRAYSPGAIVTERPFRQPYSHLAAGDDVHTALARSDRVTALGPGIDVLNRTGWRGTALSGAELP